MPRRRAGIRRGGNGARNGDEYPQSIGAQSYGERSRQITALRANTRRQNPHVGCDRAHARQRHRIGGTDHETDVAARVPRARVFRHHLEQRAVCCLQTLKLVRVRV